MPRHGFQRTAHGEKRPIMEPAIQQHSAMLALFCLSLRTEIVLSQQLRQKYHAKVFA